MEKEVWIDNSFDSSETSVYNGFNQLVSVSNDNVDAEYTYAPSGLRHTKTVDNDQIYYVYDGDNVIAELYDDEVTAYYLRGLNLFGSFIGRDEYFYLYNAHGDVVNLTDTSGYIEYTYRYDAFGNEREPESSDSNPFRYCGEYYDGETGSYYLRARYYDPVIGRFMQEDPYWTSANRIYEDALSLSKYSYQPQITAIMQSGNLYVYCGDNPVGNSDPNGYAFETVFDVVTLGFSVAEVIANPYDPMVWAGLVGDTIDLIPFVTGVGETVRGLRFIDKAGNVLELSNAVDFTDDVVDTLNSVERIDGITKSSSYAGIKIHSGYKKGAGFAVDAKEYTGRAGIRPDYYDKQVIYELKPFNPRAAKSGVKQLKKYNDALGGKNTMRLEFY